MQVAGALPDPAVRQRVPPTEAPRRGGLTAVQTYEI